MTTIDPAQTVDTASIELMEQLFLGLTTFDPESLEPRPMLAESWETDEGGAAYRFHLRQDARWTNGRPVTAEDVVWSIRRNLRPETKAPYASMLFVLKNARAFSEGAINDPEAVGVRALGDDVVEFRLEAPAAYFPSMLGAGVFRPVPREAVEANGEDWTLPEHIIANGPYTLRRWDPNREIVLGANPDYFDAGKTGIPEVHYLIVPESSIGLAMYEHNDLDVLGSGYLPVPADELDRIQADPVLSAEYHNGASLCTYYLGFNTRRPPTDNPLVRKAISAAVDRQLLVDAAARGDQEPAYTFARPPIFGAVDPSDKVGIHFDPEQARQWLKEAGYPNGEGLPPLTLLYNNTEFHHRIAQAVQSLLHHYLNIQVKLDRREWDDFIAAAEQPKTPNLFRFGWCSDYPDANNWLYDVFHPDHSTNEIGWNNREFATQVEEAQRETDPERRKALYRRAEQILTEDEAAIVPLFFHTAQVLVKPWVKGWYAMPLGGQHIRNWSFEGLPGT